MSPSFQPPSAPTMPRVSDTFRDPDMDWRDRQVSKRLFRHFGNRARGSSVLKIDGVYRTVAFPDQRLLDSATEVYLGGHVYDVSDEVACALVSAGIPVESPLGWVWSVWDVETGEGVWMARIGAVPAGYSYPATSSPTPDISALLVGHNEIDIFSGSDSLNPCTLRLETPHVYYLDFGGGLGNQWGATAALPGTVPVGPHLYVMVLGVMGTRADPMPTWAPVEALG